jgi:hypothetical protein
MHDDGHADDPVDDAADRHAPRRGFPRRWRPVRRHWGTKLPAGPELEALAQLYVDAGMRPPMLTVKLSAVDVSNWPDLWPASVRDFCGAGRLEPC